MSQIDDFLHNDIDSVRQEVIKLGVSQGAISGSLNHLLSRVGKVEKDSVTKESLKEFKEDITAKLDDIEKYVKEARFNRKIWRWVGGCLFTISLGVSSILIEKIDKVDIKLDQHFVNVDGE